MHNQDDPRFIILALAATGALAAMGRLLVSDEKLTIRASIGGAVGGGVISMSALLLPAFVGHMDTWQLIGAGSVIGSLGVDGIEAILRKRGFK